jgi:HSP20 family protein
MNSFDEYNDKRKGKNSFNSLNNKEFDRIFKEIKRMFESNSYQGIIEEMLHDGLGSNEHFIHSININILPIIVQPESEYYSGCPLKNPQRKTTSSKVNAPLPDIIKADKEITVTIEIPNIEKEDIDIDATENSLEIIVNYPKRKYHKFFNLPCCIIPKTVKSTYKNGVLDIVMERKERGKTGSVYRPTI